MIDKPVYIIIAVYCFSFSLLGAQYLADSYGITLRAPDGTAIRSAVIDYIQIGRFNTVSDAVDTIATNNSTIPILDAVAAAFVIGYNLIWEVFLIFTGFYVFNVLIIFGIPAIYIIPITVIYLVMLVIFIVAKIRGI